MRKHVRNRALAIITTAAVGAGVLAGLGPIAGNASSHREAPLTAADPQIDNTDVYAFTSPDRPNTVTLVSNWIPLEEPAGGPNFYMWAEHTNYDIKIDNDGGASADVTYRWKFTTHYRNPDSFIYNNGPVTSLGDPNLLQYQTYDLYRITGAGTKTLLNDAPVVPSNVGKASMPHYNALFDAGVKSFGASSNPSYSWVGQADDPFFLDLRVFDLLYGANFSEVGDDTLAGFNVNAFAIQVPKNQIKGSSSSIVAVWSTASRPNMRINNADGSLTYKGTDVQVSRLGSPLVNEVVVPVGSKDYFNASNPKNDAAFLPKVNDPELAHLITAVYPSAFPKVPDSDPGTPGIQRADLVQVFLTGIPGINKPAGVKPAEFLRLNLATPLCSSTCSTLGVLGGDLAGFPNGRRLTDDVVDIELRAVEGVLLPVHAPAADTLGDGVNKNDVPFLMEFPYLGYPTAGSDPSPH